MGEVDQPPSLHRYVYGWNRPTFFTDPTGNEVFLANETQEGRQKALYSLTPNLTVEEQRNLHYVRTHDGRYQLNLRDPDLINLDDASPAYRGLHDRVIREDLDINYTIVEEGRSEVSRKGEVRPHGEMETGETIIYQRNGHATGEIDVFIPEGRDKRGVKGFTESGKEVGVAQPTHVLGVHELLGETELIEGGKHIPPATATGPVAIEVENEIRRWHGLPERTGSDHGAAIEEYVTVTAEAPSSETEEEDERENE